jgi:hypothetical protein
MQGGSVCPRPANTSAGSYGDSYRDFFRSNISKIFPSAFLLSPETAKKMEMDFDSKTGKPEVTMILLLFLDIARLELPSTRAPPWILRKTIYWFLKKNSKKPRMRIDLLIP